MSAMLTYCAFPLMVPLQKALWMKVEKRCTQALTLNKVYIKALHRRAKARMAVEKFRDALLGEMNVLPRVVPTLKQELFIVKIFL